MKLVKLGIVLATAIMLTGCNQEPVRTVELTDDVRIVELNYEEERTSTSFISSGKTLIPVTHYHDAVYEVEFDYDGIKFTVDDEKIYNKVKNKKYELVKCELEMIYYDDNSYEIKIINVK